MGAEVMPDSSLHQRLVDLKRRLLRVAAGCGAGWAVVAIIALLILAMWLDLMVELPSGLRVIADIAAIIIGVALFARLLVAAVRGAMPLDLGRRIDIAAGAGGQVVSGIDLMLSSRGTADSAVSAGLAQLAVERAERIAATVAPARVLSGEPLKLKKVGQALFVVAVVVAAAFIAAPRLATTQLARFADPFGDHPPYSSVTFDVTPGNTRVVYGGSLDIKASPRGGAVEQAEVVLQPRGAHQETLPMFPGGDGSWQATITDVTAGGTYFVRARGARTRQFDLNVITVPEIRDARFRITPPSYTHRPPYEGPLPQGGIAGLVGTKVELWLKSNRPLSGGTIAFEPNVTAPSPTTKPINVAQPPSAVSSQSSPPSTAEGGRATSAEMSASSGADEAARSFVITSAGTMRATVVDSDGQRSTQSLAAPVIVLTDDRPFVRLLEPRQLSFATPDVTIPVQLAAEDDYGLSRLQLFRGLNQLRATPQELEVPPNQPTRLASQAQLTLGEYGLKPGDTLKLYARVEDNDPAGPKGAESPVAIIRIISNEDMDRMQLAQEGMEVLQSKYEQAQRRMEAIDQDIEKLLKQLESLDPNSVLAKEKREQIDELASKMDQEANAMDKAANQDLPYDVDKAMRQQLKDLTKQVRDAAAEARKLSKKPGLNVGGAAGALKEMQKQLQGDRQEVEDKAVKPLDSLAKIFPLKQDEARFVELYARQRELEQRMQSIRGLEKIKDNPQLSARLRDFEDEQQRVQQDLRDLLADIDNHVMQLPPEGHDERIDQLRKTSTDFVADVRASTIDQQMAAAQAALADFWGTQAHTSAKDAADTMQKFLSKCSGMGEEAGTCLKFQPGLSDGLGNTVDQMLASMGNGGKPGMGTGNGGGYSARRSTMNNVGMYGRLPTRSSPSGGGGGKDGKGITQDAQGGTDTGDAATADALGKNRTAGEAAASVPPQYRRRVGDYFRRVADELGEQKR
jgi:hypothetical protein